MVSVIWQWLEARCGGNYGSCIFQIKLKFLCGELCMIFFQPVKTSFADISWKTVPVNSAKEVMTLSCAYYGNAMWHKMCGLGAQGVYKSVLVARKISCNWLKSY